MENMGIYKALAAITGEIGAITKDKRCEYGAHFNYRGIDDVYNALNPLLGKYGVFVLPRALEHEAQRRATKNGSAEHVTVRMCYRFCQEDGSFVECETIGEAMDSGDKATNKAMAIAHKYAILQMFCIPTEDLEDPDATAEKFADQVTETRQKARAANPDPASDPQRKKLFALMGQRHGNDRAAILADLSGFFNREIKSSNELTRSEVSAFLDAITTREVEEA